MKDLTAKQITTSFLYKIVSYQNIHMNLKKKQVML